MFSYHIIINVRFTSKIAALINVYHEPMVKKSFNKTWNEWDDFLRICPRVPVDIDTIKIYCLVEGIKLNPTSRASDVLRSTIRPPSPYFFSFIKLCVCKGALHFNQIIFVILPYKIIVQLLPFWSVLPRLKVVKVIVMHI